MANAAVQSQTGMTALLEAARNGHATCVDVLQNFKPTLLDQVCNDGNSVLHHACVSPEHASLQVLLDFKGTDVHILNKEGQTAAQYARAHETESALEAAGKVEEFVKAEEQKIQHAVAARQDKEESAKKIQSFLKKKAAKRDHENSGQHPGFRPQFTPLSSEELFKERYQHKQQPSKSKRATIKEEEKSEDSPADIDSFVQQFHVPASIQPHVNPAIFSHAFKPMPSSNIACGGPRAGLRSAHLADWNGATPTPTLRVLSRSLWESLRAQVCLR